MKSRSREHFDELIKFRDEREVALSGERRKIWRNEWKKRVAQVYHVESNRLDC